MRQPKHTPGKAIIPYNVYPEKHELETVALFLKHGFDVEFIKVQTIIKSRSPDVIIAGIIWELKSPTGNSKYTIQNQFKRAARQSKNLILDLRRTNLADIITMQEIEKQFKLRRSIRKLKVVTKHNTIIDFHK